MVIASYTGSPKEVEAYLLGRNSLSEVKLESSANEYQEAVREWGKQAIKVIERHDNRTV